MTFNLRNDELRNGVEAMAGAFRIAGPVQLPLDSAEENP
jgi:hypothetical protein